MTRPSILFLLTITIAACGHASAASTRMLKFWNLTAAPITDLQLSPVGTGTWSANICLSDPDRAVDPDERLNLPGVAGGIYDVRITDQGNRKCLFHAVTLKVQGPYAFSISEQQMKTCAGQ